MGGGDLNLKKSWHPTLLRNQERVWSEEKRALEERKRIDQLRRERDEEREIQDLHRLQEESGQQRRQNRVDWMYQAPTGGVNGGYGEEMEGYLLGKRRIDGILLKRDEEGRKVKEGAVGVEMAQGDDGKGPTQSQAVTSGRDMMAKIGADPLLEIKKREQGAWEEAVKESVRREDRERRRKERERGGGRREREREHRHRSRSRSPDRRRRWDEHRSDRDRDYRRDHRHGYSSRHRDRDADYDSYRDRRASYHRRRSSSSPDYHERRDHYERRSRDHRRDRDHNRERDNYQSRNRARDRAPPIIHNHNPKPNGETNQDREAERQRKLAEMQSSAQDMEHTRRQRIADVSALEERQREEEDRQRSDRGRFVGQLHQQVQGGTLDDRLRRGKSGLAIDAD